MITMNQQEAEYMANIYNSFFRVSTNGDSTILMGKALEALRGFMSNIEVVEEIEEEQEG